MVDICICYYWNAWKNKLSKIGRIGNMTKSKIRKNTEGEDDLLLYDLHAQPPGMKLTQYRIILMCYYFIIKSMIVSAWWIQASTFPYTWMHIDIFLQQNLEKNKYQLSMTNESQCSLREFWREKKNNFHIFEFFRPFVNFRAQVNYMKWSNNCVHIYLNISCI